MAIKAMKTFDLMDKVGILGRGVCYKSRENPGIAKIGLTPPRGGPPAPQSWHSGGFHDKKRVNATRDN